MAAIGKKSAAGNIDPNMLVMGNNADVFDYLPNAAKYNELAKFLNPD